LGYRLQTRLEKLKALDEAAFRAVNSGLNHDVLDPVMAFLSSPWPWWTLAACVAVYAWRGRKRLTITVLLVSGAALGITDAFTYQVLKPAFARERPCHQLQEVMLYEGKCGGDYGFPSNHASNGGAAAAAIAVFSPAWGIFAAVLAFAVGFTRIYLGVHFPADILVGFMVGGLIGFFFARLAKHLLRRWI
jgi:undecaprenyl-diphosphatase